LSECPSRESPRLEAVALFRIFRATKEPAETIRALISPEPNATEGNKSYRGRVLEYFDRFVAAGRVYRFKLKPAKQKSPKDLERERRERETILVQLERVQKFIYSCMVCQRKIQLGFSLDEPEETPEATNQGDPVTLIAPTPSSISRGGPGKKLSEQQIVSVHKAVASGATFRDLAGRFGVAEITIARAQGKAKAATA
jgi:hypothetical protein